MTNARPKQTNSDEAVKTKKANSNQEKSLLETLNESEINKVIAKLQETLNSEENIDAMVEFAINTADILEIDWEAVEEPDLIEFIIFCNTYYAQFLTNYMQSDFGGDSNAYNIILENINGIITQNKLGSELKISENPILNSLQSNSSGNKPNVKGLKGQVEIPLKAFPLAALTVGIGASLYRRFQGGTIKRNKK